MNEALEKYEKHIQTLILPKESHMDFNIAFAIFMATNAENARLLDEEKWFSSDEYKEYKA